MSVSFTKRPGVCVPSPPRKTPRESQIALATSEEEEMTHTVGRTTDTIYVADVNPTYPIHGAIRSAACVNDRIVWTAEADGEVRVRSLPKGTVLKSIASRKSVPCTCLLYLPLQHYVWNGFNDGSVRVYDAANCTLLNEFNVNSNTHLPGRNKVHAMVEVEGCVFIACEDGCVVQRNALDSQLERILSGHKASVRALAVYAGPTGSVVFSGSSDGTIKGWDPYKNESPGAYHSEDNAACIHTFREKGVGQPSRRQRNVGIRALEVVSHTNRIWAGEEDYVISVWNMETLKCEATLKDAHTAPVTCLLAVESRMWTGDTQGRLLLWDIVSLTLLQDLSRRQGLDAGELWFIKKIQRATSWKVWTAGAKGLVQCWNAEASPVLFRRPPTATADKDFSPYEENGGKRSAQCDAEPWTVLIRNDSDDLPREVVDVAQLGLSLASRRDRLRIHRERQIQQLLEEENAFLKSRIEELETACTVAPPSSTKYQKRSLAKISQPCSPPEDDMLAMLRQEREAAEKELELLRGENKILLQLLEQHTGHHPTTPPSHSEEIGFHTGTTSILRSSKIPKRAQVKSVAGTKTYEKDSQTLVQVDDSGVRRQNRSYQEQIRRLFEEKSELERALQKAGRERKDQDLTHDSGCVGTPNRPGPTHKDRPTSEESNEVAALREELGKAWFTCAKKTVEILKLQRAAKMPESSAASPLCADDSCHTRSPLLSSHTDPTAENLKLASSCEGANSTAPSSVPVSSDSGEDSRPLQRFDRKLCPSGVPDEAGLSLEARNLTLSVRLTDAESVIAELEALLRQCMHQLVQERQARQRGEEIKGPSERVNV